MEVDRLDLLKNIVDAHNVKMLVFNENCEDAIEFDEGLRRQLYYNYDYELIIRQFKERCESNKIYFIRDAFGLYYILLRTPVQNDGIQNYVVIGPYIEEKDNIDVIQIVNDMGLELYQIQVLKNYYNSIALVNHFEQIIHAIIQMMFKEVEWKIEKTGINFPEINQDIQLHIQPENMLSMEIVEKRYQYENKVLEAISMGDEAKAELEMRKLSKCRIEIRNIDSLREAKNNMIIMNVLFRKAVENAGVHPYYIDELSSSIAKRIERANSMLDIANINREFVHKYCLLVKNYALKEYSDVIAECINYIEFNLTENLTLNFLAEKMAVNASSLSSKFKKELGCTLTDYINQKRVKASLILLVTTKIPIREVGERVGYFNESYFSRVFHKLQGMTPREYRALMTSEKKR